MSDKMKHTICGQVQGPISSKYLLSMLYDLADGKGEFVMSANNMRRLTGFSTTTIRRSMRRLQQLGYLKVVRRINEDGGCASNKYTLIPRGGG